MMLINILLSAFAESIFGLVLDDISQRKPFKKIRQQIKGSIELDALKIAIAKASAYFANKYPHLEKSFFDESLWLNEQVIQEFSKLLLPGEDINLTIITKVWKRNFSISPQINTEEPIKEFITLLEREISAQPELLDFFISKNLKSVLDLQEKTVEKHNEMVEMFQKLSTFIDYLLNNESPARTEFKRITFSGSITDELSKAFIIINELTEEQVTILNALQWGKKRLAVHGCAGSGKTLLAAEKALWMDRAGQKTLVLCHNPWLADYLRRLTKNPRIQIFAFREWLSYAVNPHFEGDTLFWTIYDAPMDQTIDVAFQKFLENPELRYDAIIVDEGQDFNDLWWVVIEAALLHEDVSSLFVFYDNNQSLLPKNSEFLSNLETLSMTKNCRNVGNIFSLVKLLTPEVIEPSRLWGGEGQIAKWIYGDGEEIRKLEQAITKAQEYLSLENLIILTTEPDPVSSSNLNNIAVFIGKEINWQEKIYKELKVIDSDYPSNYPIPRLSDRISPSQNDIRLVSEFSSSCLKGAKYPKHPIVQRKEGAKWRISSKGKLEFGRDFTTFFNRSILIANILAKETWADDLPTPRKIMVSSEGNLNDLKIQLRTISQYKGLESDGIILFIRSHREDILPNLYVGFSRAKYLLHIVVDESTNRRIWQLETVPEYI